MSRYTFVLIVLTAISAINCNNVATYVSQMDQLSKDLLVGLGHCSVPYVGLTDTEKAVCNDMEGCCAYEGDTEDLLVSNVTVKGYSCWSKTGGLYELSKAVHEVADTKFVCFAKYLGLTLMAGLLALLN